MLFSPLKSSVQKWKTHFNRINAFVISIEFNFLDFNVDFMGKIVGGHIDTFC
jgi:hypothetical protein